MIYDARLRHRLQLALLGIYGASGFTALLYQMLWTRYFRFVFGSTFLAVTTVVSTFMAGLALGSYYFGSRVDRNARPLRLYALMEAGIGLYALLFPVLFFILESLYLALSGLGEGSFLAKSLIRFALSVLFLIVPTFLMGGTFPVICKYYVQKRSDAGFWVGRLYGVNTLGGVAGVLLGGLSFPVLFGMRASLMLAAMVNLLLAYLAWAFSRRVERPGEVSARPQAEERPGADSKGSGARLALFSGALFFSGFTALSFEILWVRVLGVVLGSSAYAFTLILAVYLVGIALGSGLYARFCGHRSVTALFFSGLLLSIGLLAVLTFPLVNELPYWIARFVSPLNFSFLTTQFLNAGIVALLILLATLAMGATIPCAVQLVSSSPSRIGRGLGVLYGLNTIGSILGAFLTGFFLIPALGIRPGFLVMAALNLSVGLVVVLSAGLNRTRQLVYGVSALAVLAFLLLIPPMSRRGFTSATFLYTDRYENRLYNREVFERAQNREQVVFYRDGISSTVAVLQGPEYRYLTLNGKSDASTEPYDMSTQTLLAYLPMMIHPRAREVLVIGLGSGVTLSSVLDFPADRVTQVEIEPAVVEAAEYFTEENQEDLGDPRVELLVEDGRNYLLSTRRKFDVIISEPSNPWMAGVANLFSREHFSLFRDRLAEGGIVCQWLQLYSLRPSDIRMILHTFQSVFPNTHVFQSSPGDVLLMGLQRSLQVDPARIAALFQENPPMQGRLERIHLEDPLVLLEWAYRLSPGGVSGFVGTASRIHSDDRPYLEFSAPRSLHEAYYRGVLEQWSSMAPPSLVAGDLSGPDVRARHYLKTALVSRRHQDSVREEMFFAKAEAAQPELPELQLELADRDFNRYRIEPAIDRTLEVLRKNPGNRPALLYLAKLYLTQGRIQETRELVEKLVDGSDAGAAWARLRLAEWEPERESQVRWLEEAEALDPGSGEVLSAWASHYRRRGDRTREWEYLLKLVMEVPMNHAPYLRLGEMALEDGNFTLSKDCLLTAVALQPGNAQAHALLAQAYLALGEAELAGVEYLQSLSLH